MDNRDAEQLLELLTDAYLVKGRAAAAVTLDLVRAWIRTLPDVPISHVERALQYHARDTEKAHPPTPADVLSIIRERTGGLWLSADEAWATALEAMDESMTVVWSQEAASAWGIAKLVMDAGDQIGARMAFRDAYRRLVREAQEGGRKPKQTVSLGHDTDLRAQVLANAVDRGLLTQESAARFLPPPMTEAGAGIAGLLTGNVTAHPSAPPAFIEGLKALKAKLAAAKDQEPAEDDGLAAEIAQKRSAAAAVVEKLRGEA